MTRTVVRFGPAPRKPTWNGPQNVCVGCKYDQNVYQLNVVREPARELNEPNEFGSSIPH